MPLSPVSRPPTAVSAPPEASVHGAAQADHVVQTAGAACRRPGAIRFTKPVRSARYQRVNALIDAAFVTGPCRRYPTVRAGG
jgi:hypothetical protein